MPELSHFILKGWPIFNILFYFPHILPGGRWKTNRLPAIRPCPQSKQNVWQLAYCVERYNWMLAVCNLPPLIGNPLKTPQPDFLTQLSGWTRDMIGWWWGCPALYHARRVFIRHIDPTVGCTVYEQELRQSGFGPTRAPGLMLICGVSKLMCITTLLLPLSSPPPPPFVMPMDIVYLASFRYTCWAPLTSM